ncbi:MAG: glycosyltransferase [Leptospirales bacterium]
MISDPVLDRETAFLAALLLTLGGIGVFFDLLAFLGSRKLLRQSDVPSAAPPRWPSLLMIKPVKGIDEGAEQNFLSFIRQDYPDFRILFVVGDPGDPVVHLIEGLVRQYPDRVSLKIVTEHSGTNRKMNNVSRAFQGEAAELILLNDSDIRVSPSYLKTIVAPLLRDPAIGMVTCFQRGTPKGGWSSRLASLMLNTEAIPQALVAYLLFPIDFAFGPTMLLRREALEAAGGFFTLTDVLADDYHLGQKIVQAGYRIFLSPYIVDAQIADESWSSLWQHEMRWVRTYRNCRPVGYAFSILTRPFIFLLSGGVLGGLLERPLFWELAAFLYLIHFASIAGIAGMHLLRPLRAKDLLLFPIREVFSLVLYLGSFGSRIVWRGHPYRILRDGTLIALDTPSHRIPPSIAQGGEP